jgi:hypothetical protein
VGSHPTARPRLTPQSPAQGSGPKPIARAQAHGDTASPVHCVLAGGRGGGFGPINSRSAGRDAMCPVPLIEPGAAQVTDGLRERILQEFGIDAP